MPISMDIKVPYIFDQNSFTCLEFSNFTIFDLMIYIFIRVNDINALAGFKFKTCCIVVNALSHCATLLGNYFGNKTV